MTISNGRTSFEYYLDESFIFLERYLDLVPSLILEFKNSQIKEVEKIIADEKGIDIKEIISTHLFSWNRFEDFDEMPDIFFKSYLISLCSFCESFISKLYKELLDLNKIEIILKNKKYFNDYWVVINNYIGKNIEFEQSKFYKVFEFRNLIVHGNSLLVNPYENAKNYDKLSNRNLYVYQFVEKYPESLKVEKDYKLIFCDNKFLKVITSIFHDELLIILSNTETKLSELNLHIDPYK